MARRNSGADIGDGHIDGQGQPVSIGDTEDRAIPRRAATAVGFSPAATASRIESRDRL
jgi:hypothetical protein